MAPRITYAALPSEIRITQEQLASLPKARVHEMRVSAFRAQHTNAPEPFWCGTCGQRLYPRLEANHGAIWAHLANPEDPTRYCPLMGPRLTYRQLDARLYGGREEGPLHRRILDCLEDLANRDPGVTPGTVRREAYLHAQIDGFRGRFPDLFFEAAGQPIAIEVQTAPITVHRLVERSAFYERAGIRLLWVTWAFDPDVHRRAWYWDVIAADFQTVYSMDDVIAGEADRQGRFLLRQHHLPDVDGPFQDSIVGLSTFSPRLWAADFKSRWIEAAAEKMSPYEVPFEELSRRAGISVEGHAELWFLSEAVNLLIALEADRPVGRRVKNVLAQANSLLSSEAGMRARGIILQALRKFQPKLYEDKQSLKDAVHLANEHGAAKGIPSWTRADKIGRLRDVLFPDWVLRN